MADQMALERRFYALHEMKQRDASERAATERFDKFAERVRNLASFADGREGVKLEYYKRSLVLSRETVNGEGPVWRVAVDVGAFTCNGKPSDEGQALSALITYLERLL